MRARDNRSGIGLAGIAVLWTCLAVAGTANPAVASGEGDAASTLPATLEGYRALSPAVDGIAAKDRAGRIGHLELHLDDGTVYPLKGAGGDVLGFYFDGKGHYSYKPEGVVDRLLFETNLRRYASGLRPDNHEVGDRFEHLVVFFAAPTLSELWEAGTGAAAPLNSRSRAAFEKIWKRLVENDYLAFDHLTAEARTDGGKLQYVWAEIEGEKDTLGYSFDRMREFHETLATFVKYADVDARFPRVLSRLEVPAEDDLSVAWRLKDARLDVATEDNRRGRVESDLTLEAARGNLLVAPLSLVNNCDPYSYDWASERHGLRVIKVTDAAGVEIPFSHRYNELLVQLPKPLEKGGRVALHVTTEGDFFADVSGENVDNYFGLFGFSWFPEPIGWNTNLHTFTLRVRTRKPYVPVSSGTTTALREDDKHFELESASTVPVRQVAVFAGKYKTHEDTADGLTIRVHSYAMANKFIVAVLPGLARELIRYYRDQLGPYPFDKLEVVEVPEYGIGIAPSGMILLPTEAYKPRQSYLAAYLSRGVPSMIAHEIAHQWFGHKAATAAPEENWLSESFAEYLAGLAMGAGQTDERRVVGFKRMYAEWRSYAMHDCPDLPLIAANSMGGREGAQDRWCLLYSRGPLVLHMLRTMVGEEKFFAILRRYLDRAAYGTATTEDLKKAASETMNFDLGWFFDEWFREGGIPTIKVEQTVESGEGGKYVLSGRVQQDDGPAFKKMVIPLVLDYPNGGREVKIVFQERPAQEFRFELRDKPKKVAVDPSNNNLAVYR
jgi:hypothetical protein